MWDAFDNRKRQLEDVVRRRFTAHSAGTAR
jgi:hypothetical protein